MKLSGRIISFLLAFTVIAESAANTVGHSESKGKDDPLSHLFGFEREAIRKTYALLPPDILAFEKLDFDARMVQQEYLRLKYGDQMFMDTLRYHILKQDEGIDTIMMAMEIVSLGCPVARFKPNSSIRDIAEKCGLKRLCTLIEAQENQETFWRNKDRFYREGLSAEITALDEVGTLFDVSELIKLKTMALPSWKATPTDTLFRSYHEIISERARKKLNEERQLYAQRSLPEWNY